MQTATSSRIILDRNVRQLSTFIRQEFNPDCAQSWTRADRLFRAAVMSRDVVRTAYCRECDRQISAETFDSTGGYCLQHADPVRSWRETDDYAAA